MGLLTFAVLLETRAGPCDEACYQDHRGCNEILCAFTLVKRDVYTQISQVHLILSSWVSFCGRWLGLFKWDLIAAWEMGLYFQLRRENVARQENLILNHEELFCVKSPWTKGCLEFLDSCCHSFLETFSPVTLPQSSRWAMLLGYDVFRLSLPRCLQWASSFFVISSQWKFLQLRRQWHRHLLFSSTALKEFETGLSIWSSLEVHCNYLQVLNKSGFSRDFHSNWISH